MAHSAPAANANRDSVSGCIWAIARARRDPVPPAIDHDEIQKVLVKVIDVLDHPALELAARADIVEDRQVMDQLT